MNDDLRISPQELDAAVRYTLERIGGWDAIADVTASLVEALLPSRAMEAIAWLAFDAGSDPEIAFAVYVSGLIHGRASLHADELRISLDELNIAAFRVNERCGGQKSVLSDWLKSTTRGLMPSASIGAVVAMARRENSDPDVAIIAYIAGLLHGRASMLPPAKVH